MGGTARAQICTCKDLRRVESQRMPVLSCSSTPGFSTAGKSLVSAVSGSSSLALPLRPCFVFGGYCKAGGLSRRAAIIFLFALNIASGYLAMLVAMTYSVELFICMVVGLVAGHAFFNSEAPVGESVDPCCAS